MKTKEVPSTLQNASPKQNQNKKFIKATPNRANRSENPVTYISMSNSKDTEDSRA